MSFFQACDSLNSCSEWKLVLVAREKGSAKLSTYKKVLKFYFFATVKENQNLWKILTKRFKS